EVRANRESRRAECCHIGRFRGDCLWCKGNRLGKRCFYRSRQGGADELLGLGKSEPVFWNILSLIEFLHVGEGWGIELRMLDFLGQIDGREYLAADGYQARLGSVGQREPDQGCDLDRYIQNVAPGRHPIRLISRGLPVPGKDSADFEQILLGTELSHFAEA